MTWDDYLGVGAIGLLLFYILGVLTGSPAPGTFVMATLFAVTTIWVAATEDPHDPHGPDPGGGPGGNSRSGAEFPPRSRNPDRERLARPAPRRFPPHGHAASLVPAPAGSPPYPHPRPHPRPRSASGGIIIAGRRDVAPHRRAAKPRSAANGRSWMGASTVPTGG